MSSEIYTPPTSFTETHDSSKNEISGMKYILYCAQEANFQTRSMLIPYDLIMKCEQRVKDLQVLRDNALHDVSVNRCGKEYIVDQLLVQNVSWSGNHGKYDDNQFIEITHELMNYADGMEPGHLFKEYDVEWIQHIIPDIASHGFEHIINYCDFRNRIKYRGKPIQIVEGFLVLESNDDQPVY